MIIEFFITKFRGSYTLTINGVDHIDTFTSDIDAMDYAVRFAQLTKSLYRIYY